MTAWSEARHAGQSSRQRQFGERYPSQGGAAWSPYRFESTTCYWCRRRAPELRTGVLPIDGKLWFCPACEAEYRAEKARQAHYRPKPIVSVVERIS